MKYSIAIPAYKVKFLEKCIVSILNQDYSNFELIIVNDASPEDIGSVVKNFDDNRIKYYINNTNCGAKNVVDNWNICLSYAKGDYFVLMGDDDELRPNYLSTFDKLIDKYPALDIYHCRSYIINDTSGIEGLTASWPEFESVFENIWHRMNGLRTQFISDFLYKREELNKRGGFYKLPLAWASDDISSFEAMFAKGIAHTQEPIFCYRQSNITISNSGSVDLKMEAISYEAQWYNEFIKKCKPENTIDFQFYQNIKLGLNKYLLSKRIETLAYSNIEKKSKFGCFLSWFKKRNIYQLKLQHIVYALILSLKKEKAKNI